MRLFQIARVAMNSVMRTHDVWGLAILPGGGILYSLPFKSDKPFNSTPKREKWWQGLKDDNGLMWRLIGKAVNTYFATHAKMWCNRTPWCLVRTAEWRREWLRKDMLVHYPEDARISDELPLKSWVTVWGLKCPVMLYRLVDKNARLMLVLNK